jgi:RHS repeat-associated protein
MHTIVLAIINGLITGTGASAGNSVSATPTSPILYWSDLSFTFVNGSIINWEFEADGGNSSIYTDNIAASPPEQPAPFVEDGDYYSPELFDAYEGTNNFTSGTWSLQPVTLAETLGAACDRPGGCIVGDPIDPSTGNMFEQVNDYTTAGQNPLTFTRSYNSMGQTFNPITPAASLGMNWRNNYDRYLNIASPSSVLVERPDGQVMTFTLVGDTWTPNTDVNITLTNSGSTWTLTDQNLNVETYNVAGNIGYLQTIKMLNGYTQNLAYNGNNQLQTVIDSYGRQLGFTYNGTLLNQVTTPDGLTFTYGFTAGSAGTVLTSISYSTDPVTSQKYLYTDPNLPFALTGIIDEDGNQFATWTYNDSTGQAATGQNGVGANLTTLTYNANGTVTSTNAFGVADTYTFSTLQGVPKVSQISRAATSTTAAAVENFTYDNNGYLASQTDWNGNLTTYINNSQGNPTTINEAVGSPVARTTDIQYDPVFTTLPQQITTQGLTETIVRDANGNPKTITDLDTTTTTVPYSTNGQTRVTQENWSSTGQLLSVQLPRTDVTAITYYGYDNTGALTSITNALGQETQITKHTGGGLPQTIIDPNNVTTNDVYDGRLNLFTSTLQTTTGPLTTTWFHDPAQNLTSVTLPDNSELMYGYDTAHRLITTTDLFGNVITNTLDALGDKTLIQTTNSSGTVTQKHSGVFDALGRTLQDIGGEGQVTKMTWDPNGNMLTITPPAPSGTTSNTIDALNRLSTSTAPAPGGTTIITYDAHNRKLTVEDPDSHTTSYVYNGFGDNIQVASPDSGTTVNTFDQDSNLTQSVMAGGLTALGIFDALDRPLTTTYPNQTSLNVSRTWDQATGHGFGIGQLTSVTDSAGSLSQTFDERGNVTSESRVVTGVGTLNMITDYDKVSRVQGITYPSGTNVAYTRNIMGQVTSVTAQPPGATSPSNVVSGVTYEPFGASTGLTFGNGIKETRTYDLDYRPTVVSAKGTSTIEHLAYGYYQNNSVHTITDAVHSLNSQSMTYDMLDRLKTATSGTNGYGSYSFTWDTNSNIKTQTINGTATTYTLVTGTNKLHQWVTGSTTETVASTATGNIHTLKDGTTTLETLIYNQANQLSSAQTTSTSASYLYNFAGQRLEKSQPGIHPVLYQFGHDTGNPLLAENDLNKGTTADYIYLNGNPIGEINPTNGSIYYTHTDRLGTPQTLTSSTQAVAWNAFYRPFGDTLSFTGPLVTQSLRLPGQQFDAETGYNHNGFRNYAGALTRYNEVDPLGLTAGTNPLQYANNNPFKWGDRTGLDPNSSWGGSSQPISLPSTPVADNTSPSIPSTPVGGGPNTLTVWLLEHGFGKMPGGTELGGTLYEFNQSDSQIGLAQAMSLIGGEPPDLGDAALAGDPNQGLIKSASLLMNSMIMQRVVSEEIKGKFCYVDRPANTNLFYPSSFVPIQPQFK